MVTSAQATFQFERKNRGVARLTAGVDEAGRGPLAGPVVAAAVILNPRRRIEGIDDSKVLTADERERLATLIRARSLAWSVAWADVAEIDSLNILQATFLAMRRALCGLRLAPVHIQVDGNRAPSVLEIGLNCRVETIIQGDALVEAIGAASILAKTVRDRMMMRLDAVYPGYGFTGHKGYGTPAHCRALEALGPSAIHRRSFAPVRIAASRQAAPELFECFSNDELDEIDAAVMGDEQELRVRI